MVESFWGGLLSFGFHMRLKHGDGADGARSVGFEHATKRMWIGPFRVPTKLMAIADGESVAFARGAGAADSTEGWSVDVSTVFPLVGELVRYTGKVYRDDGNATQKSE